MSHFASFCYHKKQLSRRPVEDRRLGCWLAVPEQGLYATSFEISLIENALGDFDLGLFDWLRSFGEFRFGCVEDLLEVRLT